MLVGGAATAAAFVAGSSLLQGLPMADATEAAADAFDRSAAGHGRPARAWVSRPFPSVSGDTPVVPVGHRATPFLPWGTPILGTYPAFAAWREHVGWTRSSRSACTTTACTTSPSMATTAGVLCVNHEYTDEALLQTGLAQSSTWLTTEKPNWTLEMVRRSQAAHGVSVVEIQRRRGEWRVVRSRRNRRITANTAMSFAGPARGHRLVKTTSDPAGTTPLAP